MSTTVRWERVRVIMTGPDGHKLPAVTVLVRTYVPEGSTS